jgi:HAE1 family hydrophobic/amphiphilic exporter-1
MGVELRGQVEGFTPAKFRQNGKEYDVRVRLQEDQRNLKDSFSRVLVPNVNHKLVRLSDIADGSEVLGPAEVNRLDRGRSVQIQAGIASGAGLSDISRDIDKFMNEGATKLPTSMRYNWAGDVENSADLGSSAGIAIGFAVVLIYLILASLYGSFVTPVTILVALPLALCGAFYALYITHETMSIFATLGIFLLLGVSGKNSILLVDFANQMMTEGKSRSEAIIAAGKTRLRPILMTSFALIAGTMPIAIGLNEASKMRTAMGWAIVGGLISSTILTLVVVPAIFSYVDRYRIWSKGLMARIFLPKPPPKTHFVNGAKQVDENI